MPKVFRDDNLYSDKYEYLHKNLDKYFDDNISFVNIFKPNKRYNDLDQDLELEQSKQDRRNIIGENCINCFYSDGKHCFLKNISITKRSPICWSYKDTFTMRTSDDFQDDNEDFYEYEEY